MLMRLQDVTSEPPLRMKGLNRGKKKRQETVWESGNLPRVQQGGVSKPRKKRVDNSAQTETKADGGADRLFSYNSPEALSGWQCDQEAVIYNPIGKIKINHIVVGFPRTTSRSQGA